MKTYVLINAELGMEPEVIEALRTVREIKAIYSVYGIYDIVVEVETETKDKVKACFQ